MAEFEQQPLYLAVQKPNGDKDRTNLGKESIALLEAGGLSFAFKPRIDDTPTNIPGLNIVVMKSDDLTCATSEGEADLAIVGWDRYQDYSPLDDSARSNRGYMRPLLLKKLGFSRCTLKLGVSKDIPYTDPSSLAGLRVATSYLNFTRAFFQGRNTQVNIRVYQGGEEGVVKRGFAQACIVISDTGTSINSNTLKTVVVGKDEMGKDTDAVLKSEAVLIANPRLSQKRGSERIIWNALRAIITGVWKTQYTMLEANFLSPLPDEVLATLPGAKSPTVSALQSGGIATRSLISISTLKESLATLYAAGASEIVELEVKTVFPNLDDPEVKRIMRVIYGSDWQLPIPPYTMFKNETS